MLGFPVAQVVKNLPGKTPTEGKKLTHPSKLWREPVTICNNLLSSLLHLTINKLENYAQVDHIPQDYPPLPFL